MMKKAATGLVKAGEKPETPVAEDDMLALIPQVADEDDMMMLAETAGYSDDDAGAGLEAKGMALPRLNLLQPLSKAVSEEKPGAAPGIYFASMFDRPASDEGTMRIVPVLVTDARRRWTPLAEGGGLLCESPDGKSGRSASGLTGATPCITANDKKMLAPIKWEGGEPTADCAKCVFGPGAVQAVTGRPAGASGGWLPNSIVDPGTGKMIEVPDNLRRPSCGSNIDVLCLVRLPAFGDNPVEVVPALLTFSNTAEAVGRNFVAQLRARPREPAFAAVWGVSAKKVKNDKGTFFVPVITRLGLAPASLVDRARELLATASEGFHAEFDEPIVNPSAGSDPVPEADEKEDANGQF